MAVDSVVVLLIIWKRFKYKRWMGIWFSILITISYGLIFNSVQANTVTLAFKNAFGIERYVVGIVLAVLVAVIIFGGVKVLRVCRK